MKNSNDIGSNILFGFIAIMLVLFGINYFGNKFFSKDIHSKNLEKIEEQERKLYNYTQIEIDKINTTKSKHELLIGTGYWNYVNNIQIKRNSRGRIRFEFNMNNSYWNISDRKIRSSIVDKYWNMQRAFEKQVGLNRKISITTN